MHPPAPIIVLASFAVAYGKPLRVRVKSLASPGKVCIFRHSSTKEA